MRHPIIEDEAKYLLQTYKRENIVFERGEGCYLFDSNGNKYLDLMSGVAVNSLGHCHPNWVKAVTTQLHSLVHTSNLFYTTPMVELAKDLCALAGMDRVFYANSGTEANEAAIKIARKWGKQRRGPGCHKIITFEDAFHGRTFASLTATNKKKYCEPFEPLVPGFIQIPKSLEALNTALSDDVCAIMIEPIQGEAGVIPVSKELLINIQELCAKRNILLILDEVQTGIGRTGKWFAFQHYGLKPDIVTLAKGLASGFPIGACLSARSAANALEYGEHGSTFAGNPLACTAALAVISTLKESGFLNSVQANGELFSTSLKESLTSTNCIREIRGVGLMIGVELVKPIARTLVTEAISKGLILNATSDTTLRILPPLIISHIEIEQAVGILSSMIKNH